MIYEDNKNRKIGLKDAAIVATATVVLGSVCCLVGQANYERTVQDRGYHGGDAEVMVEDGFSIVHTHKEDSEHYVFYEFGTIDAHLVALRFQDMVNDGEIPKDMDMAVFYSDKSSKIIRSECEMEVSFGFARYDEDYSTMLGHANPHTKLIMTEPYQIRFDEVDITASTGGIVADNRAQMVVCGFENSILKTCESMKMGPMANRDDIALILPADIKSPVEEKLEEMGVSVTHIDGEYMIGIDESGFNLSLEGMDLALIDLE